ncbi:MAG: hydrogenase maturation protease [Chloroflexia bacterium]
MSERILVAGIGNIFLGDDAFGVEVVRLLAERDQPVGVQVVDFGIRGIDLAYAIMDGYDATIMVDTVQRGGAPGDLYIIEPELGTLGTSAQPGIETHNVDPVKVLSLVASLGGVSCAGRLYVVGCEPETFGPEETGLMGLSAPVQRASVEAVGLVESLVVSLLAELGAGVGPAATRK